MPESAATTARIILFFDELFDSFNGIRGQGLSGVISVHSTHKSFWQKALFNLHNMQFVDKTTLKPIRRNPPKCIKNWMWTIRGTMCLWDILKQHGFKNLNLRYINQDVIENFFGQIRSIGYRNVNPTPYQFGTAFKTLITVNITSKYSISSNCEINEIDSSLALITMFRAAENVHTENNDTIIDCAEADIPLPEAKHGLVNVHKIINNMHKKYMDLCNDCAKDIAATETIQLLQQAVHTAEVQFPNCCHNVRVKEYVIESMTAEIGYLTIHCNSSFKELLNMLVEDFILQWCNFLNKILCGKMSNGFQSNYMYDQAKNMAMRYTKKSK